METTNKTFHAYLGLAGDPNSQFVVTLPPAATEALLAAQAGELDRAATMAFNMVSSAEDLRELDVDALMELQGELESAQTAASVLLKARPVEEWEEADGDG